MTTRHGAIARSGLGSGGVALVVSVMLAVGVAGCGGGGEAGGGSDDRRLPALAPETSGPAAPSTSIFTVPAVPTPTLGDPATPPSGPPSASGSKVAPPKPSRPGSSASAPAVTPSRPASPPPSRPSGWPGPSNTGWRHTGVTLQPVACSRGEFVIDKPGTVIDGKDIPCSVRVVADGVRITRSKVTATGGWGVYLVDRFGGLSLQDVEIVGSAACEYGVGFQRVSSLRIDVSGCSDGVKMENGASLVDSWIHDLSRGADDHNDGIQITGGSNITIRHNRIENPRSQTSAILVGGEFGAPSNILIENNLLDGGNYTVYLDPHGTNRVIRGNVFTRSHVYGPARVEGQVDWSGNTYEDGKAVRP